MLNILYDVPLFSYNTFGIDATSSVFVETDDVAELADYISSISDKSSVVLLGAGSNTLFVSERCNTVIRPLIKGIEIIDESDDDVLLRVGAGEIWDYFVSWCVKRNYAGLENLSYIPGTVGACPIQNIGAYGAEAKDTLEKVETIEFATGKSVSFSKQQCMFNYRDSFFKQNKGKYLITAVHFRLSKHFEPNVKYNDLQSELSREANITIDNVRQAIISIRKRKLPDPAQLGNAGSFFKNPTISVEKYREIQLLYPQSTMHPASNDACKISAAWLILQCGWAGKRDGNVGTYHKQPLVLVNYGNATGMEILSFAKKIMDSVKEKFNIELEMEVNVV